MEVNCTEPFSLVRVPCYFCYLHDNWPKVICQIPVSPTVSPHISAFITLKMCFLINKTCKNSPYPWLQKYLSFRPIIIMFVWVCTSILTKKSNSSLSDERSSLSLVEFDVVDAVEAMPATDGFFPPGVANPPPTVEPQLRKAMKEFLTRTLLSSRRFPSLCRTAKGLK